MTQYVEELLAWVGLADRMRARPSTLSGGEKQRVAIARAVINRPLILLADEPTGNVDENMAGRLMHLFVELNKIGTTTIVATHDMRLVNGLNAPQLHLDAGTATIIEAEGELVASNNAFEGLPLPEAAMLAGLSQQLDLR